jgi:uncharacterized protein
MIPLRTITGRKIWLADPVESEIDILDIAHALSLCNRFAGHTISPYSVAQHSVLIARMFEDIGLRRWALLHDASEAYLGDVTRPLKGLPELDGYVDVERRLMAVVARKFGLDGYEVPDEVKRADFMMLRSEQRDFCPGAMSWKQGDCLYVNQLPIWSWCRARQEFVDEARRCGFPGAVAELPFAKHDWVSRDHLRGLYLELEQLRAQRDDLQRARGRELAARRSAEA